MVSIGIPLYRRFVKLGNDSGIYWAQNSPELSIFPVISVPRSPLHPEKPLVAIENHGYTFHPSGLVTTPR